MMPIRVGHRVVMVDSPEQPLVDSSRPFWGLRRKKTRRYPNKRHDGTYSGSVVMRYHKWLWSEFGEAA